MIGGPQHNYVYRRLQRRGIDAVSDSHDAVNGQLRQRIHGALKFRDRTLLRHRAEADQDQRRRKRLVRLLRKLRAMRRSLPSRDRLLPRIGAAKKEAGRSFGFVKLVLKADGATVTRKSFHFRVDKQKLRQAEHRNGHYLLRSNLTAEDPAVLWTRYIQLTQIEAAFRSLKSDLGRRLIYLRLDRRVEAHIFVAFLAYCLQVTLKNPLQIHAPGLTPTAVLGKLATIQLIDVWIQTCEGRWLVLPRYTQPAKDVEALLAKLNMPLPAQPPPLTDSRPFTASGTRELRKSG